MLLPLEKTEDTLDRRKAWDRTDEGKCKEERIDYRHIYRRTG
jgi:hypothetical protein